MTPSNRKTLRSGGVALLIGAGSIGKRHLGNLVELGVRNFFLVDPREDRRQEAIALAKERLAQLESSDQGNSSLKIQDAPTSEEAYASSENVSAVIIATPPDSHLLEIDRALAVGADLFCEKPLAKDDISKEQLSSLLVQAESSKTIQMVAYNYRFSGQLQQIRQMLQEGQVGRVLSVRGTFSENLREWHPWEGLNFYMSSQAQGGGALLDESHLVDLCRWLFGDIREVLGYNQAISSLKDESAFEVDDLVELLVRFESGAIGSLHMDLFGKFHQKRLEIIGEEGTLFWNFDNTDLESNEIQLWKGQRIRFSPEVTRRQPEKIIPTDWAVRNQMYLEEMRYFLDSQEAGRHLREDIPNLQDALKTLAVLQAARRTATSRKTEVVTPLHKESSAKLQESAS